MDKTETYIKISDCPEVQGQWQPKEGDFYQLGCKRDKTPVICVLGCHWDKCEGCCYEVDDLKHECVWLPRQDQLQGMLNEYFEISPQPNTYTLFTFLHGFIEDIYIDKSYPCERFKTWEQLWLAFVMHELHGKVWDGDKWIAQDAKN